MSEPTPRLRKAVVRKAVPADLPALEGIERMSFSGDRLSRRSLKHLLTRAHALTRVATRDRAVVGYVTVLLRCGSDVARVYSLAVDPSARGTGLGTRLLAAAERAARRAGCTRLRLEVRADNASAIHLYREAGYEQFATRPGYYEDGETALRFEKSLAHGRDTDR